MGSSDSGKTAILRALDWLFRNRPLGEVIRSWHTGIDDLLYVGLRTFDEYSVWHKRAAGKSTYELNGEELKAHGHNPPDFVTQALNIGQYNYQSQFDRHFLLSMTPAEVAKEFNKIVNLDEIDDAIVEINRLAYATSSELKYRKEALQELEEQRELYGYVPDLELAVGKAEQLHNAVQQKSALSVSLTRTIVRLGQIDEELAEVGELLQLDESVALLEKGAKELKALYLDRDDLDAFLDELDERLEQIEDLGLIVDKEQDFLQVAGMAAEVAVVVHRRDKLKSLLVSLGVVKVHKYEAKKSLEKEIGEFGKVIKKLGICPLCFSPVAGIERILDRL